MKKILWALTTFCVLGAPAQSRGETPIKIGFIGDLSGQAAYMAEDQYDAFMMLVDSNGGKLGGHAVEVLREDSKLKPEVGVQAATKLIEKDKVSIITGITFSNVMMAVHRVAADNGVFLIGSLAAPSPIAGKSCSPYQFILPPQTDSSAEALATYAMSRGFKRMVLLAPNYVGGKDFISGFKRVYRGEIVDEIFTNFGQLDYAGEMGQIASAKPDAVFAFYPGVMGISFIRQFNQAGLSSKIPLLTAAAIDGSTMKTMKDSAVGVYTGHGWGPDLNNAANLRFVADFEKRYNRPATISGAYSYDAALLLDGAIKMVNGNVADKPAFMAALKSAPFKSVRGDFAFGNNHFPIANLYVQQVVSDGKGGTLLKTVATPMEKYADSYHADCALK